MADQSDPEKARPLLGAAARIAQLIYQWKIRVDQTIDTQSALEFFARIKTRLQRIKEISGELTTIGNSQQKAAEYSASLYQDLSNDVKDFQDKLGQLGGSSVEDQP
jgi:two-component sensor histidine kinase